MTGDYQRIAVDHDTLIRSAKELHRAAETIASVSTTIAGAHLGAHVFGVMNAWMVAPVNTVSSHSRELLRLSGNVLEVLAGATDAAANDFASTEGDVLLWVAELDEQLTAGLAPLRPAAPTTEQQPQPMPQPSPSPNAAPTPPANP